ncbi:transglycosylase family protein [Streptomyces sp. NPDC090306]|uniref:LysM peptidoglycan-binding domain-containing protein n=1 Tax=Streptomyces sp. NPDC090306 TaxID=3365961 RepID=UPI003812970A
MYRTPIKLAPAAALLAALIPATAHAASLPRAAEAPRSQQLSGSSVCGRDGWPWGCIAQCESSGRWHTNTGNGFYGGLQFRHSTWKEFGGLAYARRADLATRNEQITVARKVLTVQGWRAWPVCSRKFHLKGRMHTVRSGDTLSSLAREYRIRGGWRAFYDANRKTVGARPDHLTVGSLLTIPKRNTRVDASWLPDRDPTLPPVAKPPVTLKPSPAQTPPPVQTPPGRQPSPAAVPSPPASSTAPTPAPTAAAPSAQRPSVRPSPTAVQPAAGAPFVPVTGHASGAVPLSGKPSLPDLPTLSGRPLTLPPLPGTRFPVTAPAGPRVR